jgi:site-specific DNA-cytosine methylase
VADGYKMIGNAVPVEFAKQLASIIYKDISEYKNSNK